MAGERDSKEEILRRLDMAEVVGEYVTLQRQGKRLVGLCPFHNDKNPSFSVDPELGLFYCFGCQKGGDLFRFIMDIEGLSFAEALRFLAAKAGVELERHSAGGNEARQTLLELNQRVAGSFAWLLQHSSSRQAAGARAYLAGRGLDARTLEHFQVGYAPADPSWLARFLERKGYSREYLRGSGLLRADMSALFRGRIVFPIANARGEVIGFGARALGEGTPKYLNSPETPIFRKREAVFGIHQAREAIRKTGYFLLMEGYTDVLACHQAGADNAVATLGTALTQEHIGTLQRYAARAVLVPDADDAGRAAAIRSLEALEAAGLEVAVVQLPDGEDPADVLRNQGAEKLQELLKCSISGFEYLLGYAQGRYDPRTPEGKEGIFRLLLPLIRNTRSEVKRDGYLELLAEAIDVRPESLRRELERGSRSVRETRSQRRPEALTPELYLMLAVAVNTDLYPAVRARDLKPDALQDPRAREIYLALEECYRAEEQGLRALVERISNEQLRTLILEKASSEEFSVNPEAIVHEAARSLRRERLEERRRRLLAEIRRAERTDPHELRRLIEEKMSLDQEIHELRVTRDVGSSE